MPPAGILAVAALGAIGYLYIGHPIAHGVVKVEHAIVHVFHPPKDPKAPCVDKVGRQTVVVKQPPCEVKK